MTTRKKTASGKAKPGKLKLKKETVKDLDVKGRASGVKGGGVQETRQRTCSCAGGC